MKGVLTTIGFILLVSSACTTHYGKGHSSYNIKLHEESPHGEQNSCEAPDDLTVSCDLTMYLVENWDVHANQMPKIRVDISIDSGTLEECRLLHITASGKKRKIASAELDGQLDTPYKYKVVFDPDYRMESMDERKLLLQCDVRRNPVVIKMATSMPSRPRLFVDRAKEEVAGPPKLETGVVIRNKR